MRRKEKILVGEKLRAVQDNLSGNRGPTQICRDLQINETSLRRWLGKFHLHGEQGLMSLGHHQHYSEELKLKAVKDYNEGQGSLVQICSKYDIASDSILGRWIKKYNGHGPFKSHNSQGDGRMTKGRKTTYEERVEIVAFCIANEDDYQKAADEFQVSYQQVYTWVKKYRELGPNALVDRRGKRKNPEEMNEAEKMAANLKLLEAENKRLKMENAFLKKLDELGRRR